MAKRASRQTSLAAEHFFDDVVYGLMMGAEGLPYGVGRSILVEFAYEALPVAIEARFFDLRRKRLRPIVAHPERYEPSGENRPKARRSHASRRRRVVARPGRARGQVTAARPSAPRKELVEEGAYYRRMQRRPPRPTMRSPSASRIQILEKMVGAEETQRLLATGPREILEGRILDVYD